MARSRRVEIRLTPEQFTRLQAIMAQRGFASIAGFLRYVRVSPRRDGGAARLPNWISRCLRGLFYRVDSPTEFFDPFFAPADFFEYFVSLRI